LMSQISTEPIT